MRWVLPLLFWPLLAAPLKSQTPDSVRTYQSTHTDSVKAWFTHVDTVIRVDTLRTTLPSTLASVLVGPWGPAPDSLLTTQANAMLLVGPTAYKALSKVQAKHAAAVLYLPRNSMRTKANLFSVAMAKAYIDSLPDMSGYVKDGTLRMVMVADDITGKDIWGPAAPYLAGIDTVGKYIQDKWGVPAVVRSAPDVLAKYPYRFKWVHWSWAQYHSRYGSVTAYRDLEVQKAKELGLCNVLGINSLYGGDGSSKILSGPSGQGLPQYEMTPAEVIAAAKVLIPVTPYFMYWEHSDSSQVRLAAAFKLVRAIADTTRAPVCQ